VFLSTAHPSRNSQGRTGTAGQTAPKQGLASPQWILQASACGHFGNAWSVLQKHWARGQGDKVTRLVDNSNGGLGSTQKLELTAQASEKPDKEAPCIA
jgi:hypothetical protein